MATVYSILKFAKPHQPPDIAHLHKSCVFPSILLYSNFRKYAHPLDVKGGIITEKVFPVFSESFFWTCFGLVMYIWELMGVTEKFAFQM